MTINITKSTTKELLDFYNSHAGQFEWDSVKRFSDRVSAERRVKALLDRLAGPVGETAAKPKENAKTAAKKPAPAAVAKAKPKASKEKLSQSIAQSWLDREVAAARKTHNHVDVDGVTYRSVREAFDQLSLPINKHIKFRKMLKENVEANFDGHHFKILPKAEKA